MQQIIESALAWLRASWESMEAAVTAPSFYAQLIAVAAAVVLAAIVATMLRRGLGVLAESLRDGIRQKFWRAVLRASPLFFSLFALLFLALAGSITELGVTQTWLIRLAQGLAAVWFLYVLITGYIRNRLVRLLLGWVGIPILALQFLGWLDSVSAYLDGISLSVGNIHISLLASLRTVIFGGLLFWLGAVSNAAGKEVIRTQQGLTVGTRELFAKLFEISLFFVLFVLLLQVMGINLTTLAVFGGALGIGLGFGLQQIASNFVSGIIILLDRSITIGDFVELEDGRSGTLRELNMRHGILETFDGKDIMVPNEQFITSSYTNWTHKDKQQRYSLEFQVAYSTDLDLLFEKIRATCASHPKVISGDDIPIEYRPDAEIAGFGESGIDILVEFWIEGIDDGPNRVGADLLHSIWRVIQENGMQIPFPQREVRILRDGQGLDREGPS